MHDCYTLSLWLKMDPGPDPGTYLIADHHYFSSVWNVIFSFSCDFFRSWGLKCQVKVRHTLILVFNWYWALFSTLARWISKLGHHFELIVKEWNVKVWSNWTKTNPLGCHGLEPDTCACKVQNADLNEQNGKKWRGEGGLILSGNCDMASCQI